MKNNPCKKKFRTLNKLEIKKREIIIIIFFNKMNTVHLNRISILYLLTKRLGIKTMIGVVLIFFFRRGGGAVLYFNFFL